MERERERERDGKRKRERSVSREEFAPTRADASLVDAHDPSYLPGEYDHNLIMILPPPDYDPSP